MRDRPTSMILRVMVVAIVCCGCLGGLMSSSAQGQSLENASVEVGIGMNSYIGDLIERSGAWWNPTDQVGQASVSVAYNYHLDDEIFFTGKLTVGSVEGSYDFNSGLEPGIYERYPDLNDYFESSYQSIEATLSYRFIDWSFMDIYGGLGFGVLGFEIQDEDGRNLRLLADSRNEGESYQSYSTYLPIKAGFVFFEDSQFNLIYELTWNQLNSDYLDNIGNIGNTEDDMIFRQTFALRYHF